MTYEAKVHFMLQECLDLLDINVKERDDSCCTDDGYSTEDNGSEGHSLQE